MIEFRINIINIMAIEFDETYCKSRQIQYANLLFDRPNRHTFVEMHSVSKSGILQITILHKDYKNYFMYVKIFL